MFRAEVLLSVQQTRPFNKLRVTRILYNKKAVPIFDFAI